MLPSCGQLMVLVIVGGQIWFKNLVKIWSGSGCGKSGSAQNLVRRKIWFDGKSGSTGLIRAVSSCEQVFRTGVRRLPERIRTSVLDLEIDTPKKVFLKGVAFLETVLHLLQANRLQRFGKESKK